MKLWPSTELTVDTPLPPERLHRLLSKKVRPTRLHVGYWRGGYYEGSVSKDSFTIHWLHRRGAYNSFAPHIRGKIESSGDGTRILIKMGLHPFVLAFGAVWCVVATGIGLRALAPVVNGESPWLAGLVGPGMIFALWAFASLGFWLAVPGERRRLVKLFGQGS